MRVLPRAVNETITAQAVFSSQKLNRTVPTERGRTLGYWHVRLPPVAQEGGPALGHARAVRVIVAGIPVVDLAPGRCPRQSLAGLGRPVHRPDPSAGLVGDPAGRQRAAPVHCAVPARRLVAPAGQPGVPADLRPPRRAGAGAVAVAAAV